MSYYLLKAAILPPGLNLVLIMFGLLIKRRWRRLGRLSIALGVITLWLFSTGFGVSLTATGWEPQTLEMQQIPESAGAIVVLGGGRKPAPEYKRGETITPITLARLRYGAHLHRKTGLPILVSGGKVTGTEDNPEAVLMADALEEDFRVPVRWREADSKDTYANAVNSAELLREAGIEHVVLVTQAVHLPRAAEAFHAQGLGVTGAPTAYIAADAGGYSIWDFIPSARYLQECQWVLHERIGIIWYKLRRAFA